MRISYIYSRFDRFRRQYTCEYVHDANDDDAMAFGWDAAVHDHGKSAPFDLTSSPSWSHAHSASSLKVEVPR